MAADENEWYAVRCVFQWTGADGTPFEERITLWRARDLADAIGQAETDAREYAENTGVTWLGLAQAYATGDTELGPGAEVFSLLRDSALPAPEYLDRYFATGREHQGDLAD
ncbi:hypothetical protein [Actinokineospora inagensis]|uniref:hypothetical protein n=1 Tax=Actinokineospora inagensis TaxID=103730 RepID=UPI00040DD08F|nr:hypothetical protein [Actinokineospora inagensis]